jgi:putative ATPase
MNLFETGAEENRDEPLAFKMRPKTLDGFIGHVEVVGEEGFLKASLENGKIPSLILWGPPGSGKTTLAMIISNYIEAEFIPLSAVSSGIKDVKAVVEQAKMNLMSGKKTILFLDEIHRFNKSQQDAFLPHVENGTITLIGATTENPSFEVNSALISRTKVIQLKALKSENVERIINRALKDKEKGLGKKNVVYKSDAIEMIDALANGDARNALNIVEMIDVVKASENYEVSGDDIRKILKKNVFMYDKSGDEHYHLISAFIKSMRGSSVDGAIYWATRMLESGEDPRYIARRMIVFAGEDIGTANPNALSIAVAAREAYHVLGSPEGEIPLMSAVAYLATSPKSNAAYSAYRNAQSDIKSHRDVPVPEHLRNAPTSLMKDLGYGKGYKYAHDYEGSFVEQQYLPDILKEKQYYLPSENGCEKEIKERLKKWRKD